MLTATASAPTRSASLVIFVLRVAFISLAVFGLLRFGWADAHIAVPFTLAQAALAVRLFGVPAVPISVTPACSGADVLSLCLGAVLAFPATWRRRIAGAAGGIALILALNIVRIGSLGRVAGSRSEFDALHLYIWPAVITLAIGAYVLAWMHAANSPSPAPATSASIVAMDTIPAPMPTALSRRFIVLTALFLLAFLAAAPLYLQSTVVLAAASLVARSAAMILGVFGVQAYASANVLWMPHGGFAVTQECISTPLIPVYVGAVAAYAPDWTRRSVGFAAAAPVFLALGVVRLLVVALPLSIAAQSFYVHAFYQLLASVMIVFAAAYWRHRDKTALAWGAIGTVAGTLFIAIAGAPYLRAVNAAIGVPLVDPQGAIAFLPAFQVAMYLALWAAASIDRGRARFAIGLVVLLAAQAAGLFVLNALLNRGITMAVRDVRGWAIAAPVLIFAAAVSYGRPRR